MRQRVYPFWSCDRCSREDLATTAGEGVILQEHWPRENEKKGREAATVERGASTPEGTIERDGEKELRRRRAQSRPGPALVKLVSCLRNSWCWTCQLPAERQSLFIRVRWFFVSILYTRWSSREYVRVLGATDIPADYFSKDNVTSPRESVIRRGSVRRCSVSRANSTLLHVCHRGSFRRSSTFLWNNRVTSSKVRASKTRDHDRQVSFLWFDNLASWNLEAINKDNVW